MSLNLLFVFLCETHLHTREATAQMQASPSRDANVFIKIFDPSAAKIYKKSYQEESNLLFVISERGELQKATPQPTTMSPDNMLVSPSC